MAERNIYKMKLHETIVVSNLNSTFYITRVPGGWIYLHDGNGMTTFVPFDNEFQTSDDIKEII